MLSFCLSICCVLLLFLPSVLEYISVHFQSILLQIKSNLLSYSLYYAKEYYEIVGTISASLSPENTASFKEIWQPWQAVGNTVSDLTGSRFAPQIFRSRDNSVAARLHQHSGNGLSHAFFLDLVFLLCHIINKFGKYSYFLKEIIVL